jgi:trimethylamine--corrinoid protein Co-methyltransferase
MHILTKADQSKIHSAAMEILRDIGINFCDPEAVEIFKHHGFRVDGNIVHMEEVDVQKALNTTPAQFQINARNPEKSVIIGGDHLVFVPGYGAAAMITPDKEQRPAVMADYDNVCTSLQKLS